ncbi:hypothetical protein ACFJIX_10015 [Roseateles sp. UC29_93]|uniref:hypothetical protein n=1 Tax=Roseateles sp. UC29_93 TaxID=3350177 RepID=UPI003671625D
MATASQHRGVTRELRSVGMCDVREVLHEKIRSVAVHRIMRGERRGKVWKKLARRPLFSGARQPLQRCKDKVLGSVGVEQLDVEDRRRQASTLIEDSPRFFDDANPSEQHDRHAALAGDVGHVGQEVFER